MPEMPRLNSDPAADVPGPSQRITDREERDRDKTAWLREDDVPPKVGNEGLQFKIVFMYFDENGNVFLYAAEQLNIVRVCV